MRKVTCLIVALVVAVTLGIGAKAEAAPIQLGFILDSSGSIGSGNWTTIVTGLSNAVATYIPTGSQYEVSVVKFGSTAIASIQNFLVVDQNSLTALSAAIAGLTYMNGSSTNYDAAFNSMVSTLNASTLGATTSYVNFATDGYPNDGPNWNNWAALGNILPNGGVDNVSIEGIGSGVGAGNLENFICYPGPCTIAPVYNFPTQGFYIGVPDAQGYADAIGNKIQTVVNPVPEPASLLLLGTGLIGAVRAIRRKRG